MRGEVVYCMLYCVRGNPGREWGDIKWEESIPCPIGPFTMGTAGKILKVVKITLTDYTPLYQYCF